MIKTRQREPLMAWERIVAMAAPAQPPFQHHDAEKIQENIQAGGKGQEHKGCPAVSHGTENTGEIVVHQGKRNPEENDNQVGIGPVKDILRHR